MAITTLNQDNFDKVIRDSECVVVDFWANWCGPCLAFAPTFEALSNKNPDVVFAKVDIEQQQQLAEDFQIRSIPFLMIFRREFAVFAEPGVQTETSLQQLIDDAKQIDLSALRAQVDKSSD